MQDNHRGQHPLALDVIIATYNRSQLVGKAIASILRAKRPALLDLRLYVVDNNSQDATREVVTSFGAPVEYLHEPQQGKSYALNTGIAAGKGDVVAIIDDDEEVHENWLLVISEWMAREDIDFIGGPYLPYDDLKIPTWFPPDYLGIIAIMKKEGPPRPFGAPDGPMLMGGNSVIRRSVLQRTGGYDTRLGRTNKHLFACEDEELYLRLINSGARGFYVPDLAIFHLVQIDRLTTSYCRRWCFWRGASAAVLAGIHPHSWTSVLGVPRWMLGRALREFPSLLKVWDRKAAFGAELRWWDLAGWFYGSRQRAVSRTS